MKNRLIFITLVAVFSADSIHFSSAQSFDAPVPCSPERGCADPRLPANAHCQAGFCICVDQNGVPKNCSSHIMEPKSAGRTPGIIRACKSHKDCNLPNGVCNTTRSQCSCADGYVVSDDYRNYRCLSVASTLGSICEEDQQCQKKLANSYCKDGQCACSAGFHHTGNNTCSKTVGFGELCSNNEECSHTENAECDDRSLACRCSDHAVLDSSGGKCLLVVTSMFEPCIERAQCTKNFAATDCIDKKCQCSNNNHYDRSSSQCVTSRMLGESCSADEECYQDDEAEIAERPQRCADGICVCNETFMKNYDKCVAVSGVSSIVPGILSVFSALLVFSRS